MAQTAAETATERIPHGQGAFIVHPLTIGEEADALAVYVELVDGVPERQQVRYFNYVYFLTAVTVEGDVGISLPALSAPKEELMIGLQAFEQLPRRVLKQYSAAVARLEGTTE